MTRFLTEKEIIFINATVIKSYTPTEEIRVKDPSLLKSVVYRPQQSAFGEDAYPTIWLKAAALFESIAKNHAFVGGDKGTAFASFYQFLWFGEIKPYVVAKWEKRLVHDGYNLN